MSYLNDRQTSRLWAKIKALIPTRISQLSNDSGYVTQDDIPEGSAASQTTPKMDGTASTGSENAFARGDHVHPTDTSRQAKVTASGILKGDGSGGVSSAAPGTDYQAPLPSQTGNTGKFLKTNGTAMSWEEVPDPDLSSKLDTNGDGKSVTVTFSQASNRTNIASGNTLATTLGRIKKWLADLGTLAFKSEVAKTDLASGVRASLDLADSALQSYTETDPTVPSWAKQSTKPSYTYSEVGAAASSHSHAIGDVTNLQTTLNDKESKATWTTATIQASGWSNGSYSALQTAYPHASYDIFVEPNGSSCTLAQMKAWAKAMLAANSNSNVLKALGTVPSVDIPVIVKVVAK